MFLLKLLQCEPKGSSIPFRERAALCFNTFDHAKIELRANLDSGM